MRKSSFEATARYLVFWLPIVLGAVESIVRIAFRQAGSDEFFPASLVASGVGLNVSTSALTG